MDVNSEDSLQELIVDANWNAREAGRLLDSFADKYTQANMSRLAMNATLSTQIREDFGHVQSRLDRLF